MAHKWIHLLCSVPKAFDRWISPPFHLASFTWSPHLLELEWRAIHSERSVKSQLLDFTLCLAWVLPLRAGALTHLCCLHLCPLWVCGWGRKAHQMFQWLLYLSQLPQLGRTWEPRSWAKRHFQAEAGMPTWSRARWQSFRQPGPHPLVFMGGWSRPLSPCLCGSLTSWLLRAWRTCYSLYFVGVQKPLPVGCSALDRPASIKVNSSPLESTSTPLPA